ncbi:MAG TPA: RNA polymerase sigma factor [Pirellulales bacterium]|jgi:RNA polymerase sigma-70 factor (ECF subfamily)|nr:RNA polymerase sigma factor [Pirellulales bacterium]
MADSQMAEIEAIYRDHAPALSRYLERNFGKCAPVEDLLQETFLRLLARNNAWQRVESPRAFLFGIARHVGLTALRRAKLAPKQTLTDMAATPAMENDDALAQMHAAIAQLPQPMRETLELRLRDDLSYDEIAAVLEIPVGTVRSRLHNALRLLRDVLKK